MSYILDALKRADAERERGVVPGLYARQVTTPTGSSAKVVRRPIWLALAGALTLGGMGIGVTLWPSSKEPAREVLPATPLPKITAPIPAPASTAAPQVTVAQHTPVPVAPPVAAAPSPAVSVVPARTVRLPSAPSASKSPASVATAPTLPLLADLSDELRRQIPALNISGAVYSENPGQRLLLVNNLVLNQGGQAAPEVTLEEIGAKSSIFNFRGTRFRLAH